MNDFKQLQQKPAVKPKNQEEESPELEVASSSGKVIPSKGLGKIQMKPNFIQQQQSLPVEQRPENLKPNLLQKKQLLPENERGNQLKPNIIQQMQSKGTLNPNSNSSESITNNFPVQFKLDNSQKTPFANNFSRNTPLQFQKEEEAAKIGAKKKKAQAPTEEDNKKTRVVDSHSSPTTLIVNIFKKPYHTHFKDSLPGPIKKGLTNHAGTILYGDDKHPGTFPEYSTASYAIQGKDFGYEAKKIKKYQGTTIFEFTRLKNETDGTPVMYIKELGKEEKQELSTSDKNKNKKYFHTYFKLDNSWSDTEEIEVLYNTVAKIPDGLLSQVSGINFKREKNNPDDAKIAGLHLLEPTGESSITLYDLAFKNRNFIRFGNEDIGFSTPLQFTIVHEIGHAMDGRKVKNSLLSKETARKAHNQDMSHVSSETDKFAHMQGNIDDYKNALVKAEQSKKLYKDRKKSAEDSRTEAGYGFDETITSFISWKEKETKTAFRDAMKKDGGEHISEYGSTRMNESFAEFFALYVLDGPRLKRLRPAVYEYFTTTFPLN